MPSCVFRKCSTYTGPTSKIESDVSFHLFPKDIVMKEKWTRVVREQRREDDWMPTAYSAVCSKHFRDNDKYLTKKNVRKIKKTGIPFHEKYTSALRDATDDNSLRDISDQDPNADILSKVNYKKIIVKINQDKKKLQIKNYNLARQNKRLVKKCEILQNIVDAFKNKYDSTEYKLEK